MACLFIELDTNKLCLVDASLHRRRMNRRGRLLCASCVGYSRMNHEHQNLIYRTRAPYGMSAPPQAMLDNCGQQIEK